MKKKRVYGLAINTHECFIDIMLYDSKKLNKLIATHPVGVYQDIKRGYQILLYLTREERHDAYDIAESVGFKDFCGLDDLYVDTEEIG